MKMDHEDTLWGTLLSKSQNNGQPIWLNLLGGVALAAIIWAAVWGLFLIYYGVTGNYMDFGVCKAGFTIWKAV